MQKLKGLTYRLCPLTFALVLLPLVASAQSTSAASHPRTPWGDPDLQGYYTNKYQYGTPFERPAAFAGRQCEDVSAQELAELMKKRQQEALDRAPFFGGDPEGKIGNSAEFRDIYEVTKGSRAWFVTDPADGKIPAVLPEARARVAGRRAAAAALARARSTGPRISACGSAASREGCPARCCPAVTATRIRSCRRPGFVAIRYEMVHETRVIPIDSRPQLGQASSVRHGKCARPLGRRHARRRDDELQAAQCVSQCQRRDAAVGRAFQTNLT